MTPPLETARLLLTPLCLEDAIQVQPLFARWETVRYLAAAVVWPFPEDGAHTYYRDHALPAIKRGDEWHWMLRLKTEPQQIIGSIALLRSETHNRGFWLGAPWRGQGLMTEAVERVTDFWFEDWASRACAFSRRPAMSRRCGSPRRLACAWKRARRSVM